MVKIFIDPGHGGIDSGAVANGLHEKDVTLHIAKRLKKYMDEQYSGHTIKLSRTNDQTLSLSERTNMANEWKAQFYLSIHINSGGGTGYEDYIFHLLNETSETAKLRNIIHTEINKQMGEWRNRGKKQANFHVLRETIMPAMLTENGFIDSKSDVQKLKSNSFLQKIAKGHGDGLAKAFHFRKKTGQRSVKDKNSQRFYRVVAGSYRKRENAEWKMEKLKEAGFDGLFIDLFNKKQ